VYISVAGQPLIILGDVEVANEMLDKKSAIYSDRPVMEMAGELGGFNKWTGFLAYGPRWKETRKYMHHAIGTRESLADFSSLFESETRKFLKTVLRDPENAQRHVRLYVVFLFFLLLSGEAGNMFSAAVQFCRCNHRPHCIWLSSAKQGRFYDLSRRIRHDQIQAAQESGSVSC
jgi:Cytochrome P450